MCSVKAAILLNYLTQASLQAVRLALPLIEVVVLCSVSRYGLYVPYFKCKKKTKSSLKCFI